MRIPRQAFTVAMANLSNFRTIAMANDFPSHQQHLLAAQRRLDMATFLAMAKKKPGHMDRAEENHYLVVLFAWESLDMARGVDRYAPDLCRSL